MNLADDTIETLDDLLQSDYWQRYREYVESTMAIDDPDRFYRVLDYANHSGDGSTHGEHIDDWRQALSDLDLPDNVRQAIVTEIDLCENWHFKHGSLDTIVG